MNISVVGYIRVSTASQVDGESLENQKREIEKFAKQKEWELVKIYEDKGQSGSKIEHRKQFQEMLEDAKAGKFNIILFYKLSRFARNAREYLVLSHELSEHNVNLVSIKENIDPTNQTGKVLAGILALFAEWEHETIREQMYENKMTKWKDKRTFLGKPPFGYFWNKEKKKLQINEEEAKLYRRIVNMYINQGMSYKDIVIKLNSEGLKGRQGAIWSSATIGSILKNPAYYGYYLVNQYFYEDSARGAGTKRTKKEKPKTEQIRFPIPSLIEKTEWNKISETREFRRIKTKRKGEFTETFYLRDVLYCNRCGGRIKHHIGNKRKDGTRNRYYRCYWSGSQKRNLEVGRTQKCDLPMIRAEKLEAQVWVKIMILFSANPKKIISELYDEKKYNELIFDAEKSVKQLEEKLNVSKRAETRLWEMLKKPTLDVNLLQKHLHLNKQEQITIESDLLNAQNNYEKLKLTESEGKNIIKYFKNNSKLISNIRKQLQKLKNEDCKLLIEAMVKDKKIMVDFYSDIWDEPEIPVAIFKRTFNPDIINRFVDEGKISLLSKNSTNDFATVYIKRSFRNNKNPFGGRKNR